MLYLDLPTLEEFKRLSKARADACVSMCLPTTPVSQETQASRIELGNLLKVAVAQLTDASFDKRRLGSIRRHIEGVIGDVRRVPVAGMSSGTADQLYLALRVAAVEDYLDQAEPMPFIADDLFINFDEKRAAAGFRVLNELAKKTEVLFFTHHEHLLDVARKTLGVSVCTGTLPAVAGAAPLRSEAA